MGLPRFKDKGGANLTGRTGQMRGWIQAAVGRWLPGVVALALGLLLFTGCTRRHYRRNADWEAYWLINQKSCDPRWALEDYSVYPDPRSRFYSPYNPDRPPIPPDDPSSNELMRCIYGKHGYRKWYRDGAIDDVANPDWQALLPTYVPFNGDGEIILSLPSAALLARINSQEYQRNLEEVFLSSLDVAFERFRFQVQFFGGNITSNQIQGGLPPAVIGARGPGIKNSLSVLDTESSLLLRRRFAAGADLVVGIANSFVWQFAGPDTNFATSLVNFGIFQPILRGGGKVVTLETLTRAERNLLANLRTMTRYEQGFYKSLAFGGGTGDQPNRIGGFQGGAGLSGFTGTGLGGFAGVGAGQNFGTFNNQGVIGASGAGGGAGLAGGGEGLVGGFYGVIQRQQAIRNTEASLASQLLTLGLLEANFEAGLIDLVQVDQFRQNIETERANLLRSQVAYQDFLESYIIGTLGLPPSLPVDVDGSILKLFQLIDPKLIDSQNRVTPLVRELGELPERPSLDAVGAIQDRLVAIVVELEAQMESVAGEHQDLLDNRQARRSALRDDARWAEVEEGYESIGDAIEALRARVRENGDNVRRLDDDLVAGKEKSATDLLVQLVRDTSAQLQELSLLQARVRSEKVFVEPIDLSSEEALWIARTNRLDWMNRRAAVVDQWRLIAFNANRLKAVLNVEVNGNIGTNGDNPARFRSPTGTLTGRVQFDAPLTRVSERNIYRESLIDFQRTRRSYMQYVDRLTLELRAGLRQLRRLEQNLEIQRIALNISIRRVDRTLEELNRPFDPPMPGQLPAQLGPTLSQNLLQALSDFRNTQDNFMSVWLNHRAAYMELLFDMGIIQFDDSGLWVEETIEEALARLAATGCWNFGAEKEPMPRYLERIMPELGDDSTPRLEEVPRPAITPLSWFDEDLGVGMDPEIGPAVSGILPLDYDLPLGAVGDAVERTEAARPSLMERLRARVGHWRSNLGTIPAADLPLASAPTVSKVEFIENLRRVRELSDRGMGIETIAEETGLPIHHVLAYCQAADRTQGQPPPKFPFVRKKSDPPSPAEEEFPQTPDSPGP